MVEKNNLKSLEGFVIGLGRSSNKRYESIVAVIRDSEGKNYQVVTRFLFETRAGENTKNQFGENLFSRLCLGMPKRSRIKVRIKKYEEGNRGPLNLNTEYPTYESVYYEILED